ncbi:MAG: hypothetical protein ACI89L_002753 [Phycisphaerales bacterium]|jgi:uncharacterized protein (TIGR03382 family)
MKTAALIAIAGLASVASAQSATVNLTHDDADGLILVGESVTWTMSVSFTGFTGDPVAGGGNMAINGDNAVGTSGAMTYTPTNGGNNGGSSNGAGIGFVNWTNSLFLEAFNPGSPADRSNPFIVGTFSYTGDALGTANMSVDQGGAVSAFLGIDISAFATTNLNSADVARNVQGLTVTDIPSPASAALLGLGGLVATRRRR